MEKKRFKNIRLFLKLILLYKIYSLHTFTADASKNPFSESFENCEADAPTGMKEQIPKTETDDEGVLERPKRPARLLPLKMIR